MIRALDRSNPPGGFLHDPAAAMPANIVESPDFVVISHHNYTLISDLPKHEATHVGDVFSPPYTKPATIEDALALFSVNLLIVQILARKVRGLS
jgi:hypothetical protein